MTEVTVSDSDSDDSSDIIYIGVNSETSDISDISDGSNISYGSGVNKIWTDCECLDSVQLPNSVTLS